jgi:RNA-binding protein 5/10
VDPQFPFIQVPPPASHGASATAAFYKALKTGGQHSGRRVKIDYSQSANPNTGGRSGRMANANDGTRDIGNSPSAILLFRGLDPLSGPQAIELAMKTSSGPHKEGAKGMKRIILIKDKTTLASWGFAFVEFVDVQVLSSTSRLTSRLLMLQSFPSFLTGCFRCFSGNHVSSNPPQWLSHF